MTDYERIKREFDLSLLHKKGSCSVVDFPLSIEKGGTGASDAAGVVENLREAIGELIYPVGSVYISVSSVSPAALFGGTWERIKDTFLLAAGETFAAGSTGGEASHTLTTAEMPKHTHSATSNADYAGYPSIIAMQLVNKPGKQIAGLVQVAGAGGGGAHNNMPPYIAVFIWKRTA